MNMRFSFLGVALISLCITASADTLVYSTWGSVPTQPAEPPVTEQAAFANPYVTEVTAGRIQLNWATKFKDEFGYVVDRWDASGKLVSKTLFPNTLSYVDTTVAADSFYRYRVYAFKGSVKTAMGALDVYSNPSRPLPAIVHTCYVQKISSCERIFSVRASVGGAVQTAVIGVGGTPPPPIPAHATNYCVKVGARGQSAKQEFCSANINHFDGKLSFRTDACGNDAHIVSFAGAVSAPGSTFGCEEVANLPNW